MQDNVAERLKTFKLRKSDTVTSPSEPQMNFFTAKNPKYNSTSSASSAPSSRPTSHHRRRSSVSTRRESAEMMGISAASLADFPYTDDADTSTLRRKALWALEGKRDDGSPTNYVGGFSKVEIPELSSDIERNTDGDRKAQPIYPMNSNMVKRDSLGRDRDSYGRAISQALSLKDQLHTLLEEDEEEDAPPEKSLNTHSPAVSSSNSESLPHSSSTSSSLSRNRLKPLTLSTSTPLVSSCGAPPGRAPAPALTELASKRRSSFSYRRSEDINSCASLSSNSIQFMRHVLPTPESTPTTSERPLSPSEQAFLFNNQASLLARISELERVLSSRSRPMSFVSTSSRQLSTSSVASDSQSDEMLRLIQDLKTERDDLSRDLSVSQSKVENLENQIILLSRRIESERKEAWLAKQNEQTLKIENIRLCKELESAKLQALRLKEELDDVREELENQDVLHAHRKDVSLPCSVEREEFLGKVAQKELDDNDELVHYEDEDTGDISFYSDQDSTSSTSLNDCRQNKLLTPNTIFGQPTATPSSTASISPPGTPLTMSASTHKRTSSLEQGWSFPKGVRHAAKSEPPKVDRFFDCLEILDNDDPMIQSPFTSFTDGVNQDKYGFFSGQDEQEDDEFDLPFIIPSQSLPATCSDVPEAKCSQLTPPVTPAIPTLLSTERDMTKEPVTPQRVRRQPSLIPKPSPSRSEISFTHLATPTSIPRVKISPVTPPSASVIAKGRDQGLKSPTKLPQLRSGSNNTQSASLSSNGFQTLKGTSMGFSALANYLPWTSWAAGEGEKDKGRKPIVVGGGGLLPVKKKRGTEELMLL